MSELGQQNKSQSLIWPISKNTYLKMNVLYLKTFLKMLNWIFTYKLSFCFLINFFRKFVENKLVARDRRRVCEQFVDCGGGFSFPTEQKKTNPLAKNVSHAEQQKPKPTNFFSFLSCREINLSYLGEDDKDISGESSIRFVDEFFDGLLQAFLRCQRSRHSDGADGCGQFAPFDGILWWAKLIFKQKKK